MKYIIGSEQSTLCVALSELHRELSSLLGVLRDSRGEILDVSLTMLV